MPHLILYTPYPKNSSNMIEMVSKRGQTYGTFMYQYEGSYKHVL